MIYSPNNPTIRLLTKKDAAAFYKLRLMSVKTEPRSFLETPADVKKRKPASYFNNGWVAGAFLDKKLVGIAGLYRPRGKKLQHKGTIWGVYVLPEARGKGFARGMLKLLINTAERRGIELVNLSANSADLATQGLYKSVGFEPYAVEKHIMKLSDGSYIDDIWMVQFLK